MSENEKRIFRRELYKLIKLQEEEQEKNNIIVPPLRRKNSNNHKSSIFKNYTYEEARYDYRLNTEKRCCNNCEFSMYYLDYINEDRNYCKVKEKTMCDYLAEKENDCKYFTLKDE